MKLFFLILSSILLNSAYGQISPNLELVLKNKLSNNPDQDGRWVYYADKASIEKIDNPLVQAIIPNYIFFKARLTNYLGYHVNQSTCLILFDSLKENILLVQPLWYGGISKPFVRLFIGKKFDSKDALLIFLKELNGLMEIGSGYKFIHTGYTDSLITCDLGYFKGDTYTTGGNGTNSTLRYNENIIWRKIRIEIKDLTIIKYTSINPATNDNEEITK